MQKKIKMSNTVDYLEQLENEAIYILRETAAQFEKPALLFSGGKDSIVLVHLALKAFRPGKFPFPLVHIDTGHNFPEAIQFRDELVEKIGEKLVVGNVEDSIKKYNLKTIYSLIVIKESHYKNFANSRIELLFKKQNF